MAQTCLWEESHGEAQDSSYKHHRQPCGQRPFIPTILGGQDLNREEETAPGWTRRDLKGTQLVTGSCLPLVVSAMHTEKSPAWGGQTSLHAQGLPLLISVIGLWDQYRVSAISRLQPHKSILLQAL